MRERIVEFPEVVRSDLLAFKYDDGEPWPEVDHRKIQLRRTGYDEDILARNVFTGEIIVFTDAMAGQYLTGVKADTISLHLRENYDIPIMGYNFRYKRNRVDWPKHTKYHLATYQEHPVKPPNGVIVVDLESGEEMYLTSRGKACTQYGLSKSRISQLIRDEMPLDSRYLFKHYDLRDRLRSGRSESSD